MEKFLYRIYGDNIVECERMINIIEHGFNQKFSEKKLISNTCLRTSFSLPNNVQYIFDCIPGFGRWDSNIMDMIYNNGRYF